MERGTKLGLYLTGIILVILFIFLFPQNSDQKSYFTSYLDENSLAKEKIKLNSEQLNQGSLVNITNRSIELNLGDNNLSINPISSDSENLEVTIGNEEVVLENEKEQKLDLNNDGIYDILLVSENDTNQLYIKLINDKSEKSFSITKNQYLAIIIILVIVLIFLTYRAAREYLIPIINKKRAKETEKPSKILDDLLEEIRNTKDKNKQKELYDRAKNLYKYLDDEDRERLEWLFK